MKSVSVAFCFIVCFLLFSCESEKQVDLSSISLNLDLQRLDQDLFSTTTNYDSLNITLLNKYGRFYEIFLSGILGEGSPKNPMIGYKLQYFTQDPDVKNVYQEVQKVFPDFREKATQLERGFKHYHYYFPEKLIPKIVLYHSQFSYQVAITDSAVGIGLEMYLGENNKATKMLPAENFPQYKKKRMDKKFMVADVLRGWIQSNFFDENVDVNFLNDLINQGKLYYCLERCLPEERPEVLFGYSSEQFNWCKINESNIWREIVKSNLLFSKDKKKTQHFFSDGPFTSGFPHESPARTGTWIGWKMVSHYMDEFPETTLAELMEMKETRKILKYYKPE